METAEEFDLNQTLADVVKSRDTRLWEGFPVLLANAARDYRFEYKSVLDNLSGAEEKEDFHALLLLSLALYESYHMAFYWTKQLKEKLSDRDTSQLKQLKILWRKMIFFLLQAESFKWGGLKGCLTFILRKMLKRAGSEKIPMMSYRLSMPCHSCFLPSRKSCSGRNWTDCH
jgi:hypothetical protein